MITTSGTTRDNTLAAMLGGTLILAGFTTMFRPRPYKFTQLRFWR